MMMMTFKLPWKCVSVAAAKTTRRTVTTDKVGVETTTSMAIDFDFDYCNSTLERDVTWPATTAGGVATQPCPNNPKGQHLTF